MPYPFRPNPKTQSPFWTSNRPEIRWFPICDHPPYPPRIVVPICQYVRCHQESSRKPAGLYRWSTSCANGLPSISKRMCRMKIDDPSVLRTSGSAPGMATPLIVSCGSWPVSGSRCEIRRTESCLPVRASRRCRNSPPSRNDDRPATAYTAAGDDPSACTNTLPGTGQTDSTWSYDTVHRPSGASRKRHASAPVAPSRQYTQPSAEPK